MADTPRPWHGASNPMNALHDWALKEIAALKSEMEKVHSRLNTPAQPPSVHVTPPSLNTIPTPPMPPPNPPSVPETPLSPPENKGE